MNENHNKEFIALSKNIVYYRKQCGYTQQQLADIIGMERSNLAKMENGQNKGTIETLLSLAEAFNVPIAKLFEERK